MYKTVEVVSYFQLKSKTSAALGSNVVHKFSCSCDTNKIYIGMYVGPDGRCFHAAWAVRSLFIDFKMADRNRIYQNGRVSTHSDVQCGSANRQTSFSGRGNARIKLPFSGHIANKFQQVIFFKYYLFLIYDCFTHLCLHR